eukprot:4905692-Pyramimonas_sp.AAC.1
MRRPSRSLYFESIPWVWPHGGGRGRAVDPTTYPREELLTRFDYQPVDEHERVRTEEMGEPCSEALP